MNGYKEFMLSFADGKASFINEVQISDNIKFEMRDKYLFCDNAILGHTGVSKYYEHELGGLSNKIVKIHKFDTDLLDTDSISTIIGKPITEMHPRDEYGKIKFVDGTNYKELEVGTVLNAWKDGDMIRGNLIIKDPNTITKVLDGGLKSLSLGYNSKVTKLVDNEGEYKQSNFYFNHLALVPKGRMFNAQIVDEDIVGKENTKMNIWEKIKSAFTNDKAIINEEDGTLDIGDEKHITKRYKVIEETHVYDDETGKTETDLKTHEIETHEHEPSEDPVEEVPKYIGDENKVEEEVELKATIEEEPDKEVVKEEPKEEEKIKEKDFGDEIMTKEELKALTDSIKADLITQIKEENVFGDIGPLETQTPIAPTKYKLDFQRDEALRKEAWDLMTNPVRHDGDWAKLAQARKNLS